MNVVELHKNQDLMIHIGNVWRIAGLITMYATQLDLALGVI